MIENEFQRETQCASKNMLRESSVRRGPYSVRSPSLISTSSTPIGDLLWLDVMTFTFLKAKKWINPWFYWGWCAIEGLNLFPHFIGTHDSDFTRIKVDW